MQTQKRMDMVGVGDLNGCVNWMKLTHLLSSFSLKLKASTFTSNKSIAFSNEHSREKIRPLCYVYYGDIMYANASNYAPFYTHVNSYVV